jgi:formylglycine-generating enzyme required for sulfatase activity/regulator of sigma D
MTGFGRYETVRELYRSGFTVLYSGRAAADPAEKFAVKLFQPSPLLLETEQVKTESELFLNSARIQQKAAASGAQYWAPVYECGSIPDGAFYVTDKYDRSLQQLIDVRVALTSQSLCEIVESVAKGLVELKRACGRPHGNLKATNILIAGEGDVSQATIVLSDPLPDEHIDTQVHWDSDLRDIAEFIYQLIIHRPSPAVDGWQVPDSKEWAKLGKLAKDWRNLCNRLLNAHMKPGTMTVEMLIEELARLKKIKPVLSACRLLIAAGLIVIAVAAILVIKRDIFFPAEPPSIRDWNQLLTEYESWIENLRNDLGWSKSNQREKQWKNNPHLGVIVEKIKKEASYPYFVIDKNNLLVRDVNNIETVAKLKELGIGKPRTDAALIAIEIIKYFFDPKSDPNSLRFYNDPNSPADRKEYQKWPLLVEIHDTANSFTERGWQKPGAYLGLLVESVRPEPNKPIAENVDKILELQPSLDDIESYLTKIEENQKIIQSTGNPALARFPDYIQSKLASADMDVLDRELEQVSGLADKLAKFVEDNWRKLEENQKAVENTGDPILAKFPDYIQSKLASTDMDVLARELEQISRLVDNLAKSIENIWQKADKEAFLNVHGNDSQETLTDNIFAERLDTIKDYYYLVPDPRDELSKLVDSIEGNLPLAHLSNPGQADIYTENLKKLQQDVKEIEKKLGIEKKPGIKKQLSDINDVVDKFKPELEKLDEKVIAATETPEKYHQRIRKQIALSAGVSEQINEKWLTCRDNLLDRYSLSELKENLGKYAELRRKIDNTIRNLEKLSETFQTELPSQLEVEVKESEWNNQLKLFYDQERKETITRIVGNIPLQDGIPDTNAPSFGQFSRTQFSEIQQLRIDLSGILAAFNNIEDGLNACYLLDQRLPESDQTIRLLWARWKDSDILKEPRINDTLARLTKRVKDLEEIEKSDDRDALGAMATAPNSQTEAVYAAWKRLGKLTDLPWPDTDKEWEKEKEIQGVLRAKLLAIKGENRAVELRSELDDDSLKREKIFRGANIGRYKTIVKSKSFADPVLARFETFTPYNADADLSEVVDFENFAKVLADFVTDPNWPTKFRTDLFINESSIYQKASLTKGDFQKWMEEVKDYSKLENDPRNNYTWAEKITKIDGLLSKELSRKQGGESFSNIQNLKNDFENAKMTIEDMLKLPAIDKNRTEISKCQGHWQMLVEIESKLKPDYCKRVELENERIIFNADSLNPNMFEPVNVNSKEPVTLAAGWEDIRQGIKDNKKEWLDFFYSIDVNDTRNVGWPKYIRSKEDPSVILRLIPAKRNNPQPFYMAVYEATNAQYRLFLEKTLAVRPRTAGRYTQFVDQNKDVLISLSKYEYPVRACKVEWDGKSFRVAQGNDDIPVTWVTYSGAQSYAKWLGGQLPTASQHEYAGKTDTENIHPWGNDSEIASYAHIRGSLWRTVADDYNNQLLNRDELKSLVVVDKVPAPMGAKPEEGFVSEKTRIDSTRTVHEVEAYGSAWPIDHAEKTNSWGLYDMIGNVWEWCQDGTRSVICGGSCLAPPEYVLLTDMSNYSVEFDKTACDVGFRIIVPVK